MYHTIKSKRRLKEVWKKSLNFPEHDFFARNLFAPLELNLSTVTSFIGAPIVIYLMVSRRKEKWKTP